MRKTKINVGDIFWEARIKVKNRLLSFKLDLILSEKLVKY
jgi:hypothetical protein